MLQNHAGLQKQLPTSYETTDEEDMPVTDEEGSPVTAEVSADAGADSVTDAEKPVISFSHGKTFYDDSIEVELTCTDENAVIFYTTDGNDPTEKSKRYTAPIKIASKSRVTATTVKAVAIDGEERSDIALKSYVTGKDVSSRFTEDTLVFVLSTDEYNLYDYYNGIAVEGYLRDEYLKNDYRGGEINPTAPANYNIHGRESERDMYVEVYDSTGRQLISQAAGVRVVGGYSRANEQKSFRLFARSAYGEGKFKYPFFGLDRDAYGNILTRYDRITLRDGANDREFAGVRDELSAVLAADAGFTDVQSVRPAAVFLNSEYYGFAWLHEAFADDYLEMMYGGNKDNYSILGAKELEMESDDPADEQELADWQHLLELAENGLTDDAAFEEFCSLVDIDNFMLYYAMQIYIDNKDWPGNNFKVWRYRPSEGEEVTSPYLDGRWRFLMFDAEYAWGLYGAGYSDNTLEAVLTGNHMKGASHLLAGVLERPDMQRKFSATLSELMSGAFSPENVSRRLDELLEKSDPEQMYALKNGYTSGWANEWTFADSRQQIRDFAEYRSVIMDRAVRKQFGYGEERCTVTFRCPGGGDAVIGSQTVKSGSSFEVKYFSEFAADIAALPYNGHKFGHWTINGTDYPQEKLRIDGSMAVGGSIKIELFFEDSEKTGGIVISELYTSGSGDWAELYNGGAEDVTLHGYCLSDTLKKPDRYTIPDTKIASGETVTIVFSDNNDTSALMRHQANFKLKTGETLYLCDPDGNIISAVPVTEMSGSESLSLGADGLYHVGIITDGVHTVQ